eukprot:scaffold15.g4347.t1
MGKNQAHKAMQAAKRGGGGGGPEAEDPRIVGHDASFHTAEWHAARLAALQVERPSWETWKQQQKAAEAMEAEKVAEQERLMEEYRQGLAEDRARRLGPGGGGGEAGDKKERDGREKKRSSKDKKRKRSSKDKKRRGKEKERRRKQKKEKRSKHRKEKKRRRRSSSRSGSSGSSGSSSSSGSGSDSSGSDFELDDGSPGHGGPVKLSKFFSHD